MAEILEVRFKLLSSLSAFYSKKIIIKNFAQTDRKKNVPQSKQKNLEHP